MKKVVCDYCGADTELIDDVEVYGTSFGGKLWICRPCNAWVGCHKNSRKHKPMGRLANAELRRARQAAHAAFDPIWTDNKVDKRNFASVRESAYQWLAMKMRLPFSECHIGRFDLEQCREVVRICGEQK